MDYKGKKLTFNYTASGKTRKIIDYTGKELLRADIDFNTGYRIQRIVNNDGTSQYFTEPVTTIKDTSGEYTAQFNPVYLRVVPKTCEANIHALDIYKTPKSSIKAPEEAGEQLLTYGKGLEQPPEYDQRHYISEQTGKFTVSEKENFKDYTMGYEIGVIQLRPRMASFNVANRPSLSYKGEDLYQPQSFQLLTITVTNTYHTEPYNPTDIEKIGGGDRIETSEKVSKKYFSYADNVIIARKDDFRCFDGQCPGQGPKRSYTYHRQE